MFSVKKLVSYVLYQPPRPYVSLFEAGLEDQPGDDRRNEKDGTGQASTEKK